MSGKSGCKEFTFSINDRVVSNFYDSTEANAKIIQNILFGNSVLGNKNSGLNMNQYLSERIDDSLLSTVNSDIASILSNQAPSLSISSITVKTSDKLNTSDKYTGSLIITIKIAKSERPITLGYVEKTDGSNFVKSFF